MTNKAKFAVKTLIAYVILMLVYLLGIYQGRKSYPSCENLASIGKSPVCLYHFGKQSSAIQDARPILEVKKI